MKTNNRKPSCSFVITSANRDILKKIDEDGVVSISQDNTAITTIEAIVRELLDASENSALIYIHYDSASSQISNNKVH